MTFGPGIVRAVIAPLWKRPTHIIGTTRRRRNEDLMFERHSTASRPRDDEPGEFLYLHPVGLVLALLSGAVTAGLVVLLGAWLATPLVGVGAAATLVATVGLAVAMLMPHRPRRHGARPVRPAAR
ncbi:hypothetical protein RW1_024_00150 [Rhodococcus wratislaviensis NBRC 100605]|uniref:Uncharacterized protein n=2 Tax=Rhodococcus TaxID=1827 RepID=X0PRW4_RHOWR|nr:hypothetical protein RW1_024_00150 [Rhodococcus wratislaviensis NBRC 100605]